MNLPLRIANYISRYAPSKKKLIEYISKKNHTFPIFDFIQEIWFSEDLMLDMWIRTFLSRSIGEKEIQIKLLKKWFPKEDVMNKLLQNQEEIRDWWNQKQDIESRIESLIKKGKSTQWICMIFGGKYPYFRDEIYTFLSTLSDKWWLIQEIEKYKLKYNLHNSSDKQKFYAALQRKWFRYEDIKSQLRKEAEEI